MVKFVSATMLRLSNAISSKVRHKKKKKAKTKVVVSEPHAVVSPQAPIAKNKTKQKTKFKLESEDSKYPGSFPPEYYYEQEQIHEKRKQEQHENRAKSIVHREYFVTPGDKASFRHTVNLRTKDYTSKSIQCELCNQYFSDGYRYTDNEGWIYYLCKSCAKQVGGPSGRKLIISTPMGGQNKRY